MTACIDYSVSPQSFLTCLGGFQVVCFGACKVPREEGAPSHASTVAAAPRSLPCEVHLNKGLHCWKQLKAFSPFFP